MTLFSRSLLIGGTLLLAQLLTVGCGGGGGRTQRGQPLDPQLSIGPRAQKPMAADPLSGVDQPGRLYDNAGSGVDLISSGEGAAAPRRGGEAVEGLSTTVQENVTGPGAVDRSATTGPSASPATLAANGAAAATRPVIALGEFVIIGGVVAEVNGNPIYANKVLHLVEPVLAARARELDARRFKELAQQEIKQQMFA